MSDYEHHQRPTKLVTPKQLTEMPEYSWLTLSAIRHQIFNSEDRFNATGDTIPGNGLAPAIIRLGRKVLVDEILYSDWIDSHRCAERE